MRHARVATAVAAIAIAAVACGGSAAPATEGPGGGGSSASTAAPAGAPEASEPAEAAETTAPAGGETVTVEPGSVAVQFKGELHTVPVTRCAINEYGQWTLSAMSTDPVAGVEMIDEEGSLSATGNFGDGAWVVDAGTITHAGSQGTFSGTDMLSGSEVSGSYACP